MGLSLDVGLLVISSLGFSSSVCSNVMCWSLFLFILEVLCLNNCWLRFSWDESKLVCFLDILWSFIMLLINDLSVVWLENELGGFWYSFRVW